MSKHETADVIPGKAARLSEVAAVSGVSLATVSRVLNGKRDVALATRERVLRVAREVGVGSPASRQGLSLRRPVIGVHVPQDFHPPNPQLILAAALGAEAAGGSINLISRGCGPEDLLALFRGREVDGMLLLEMLADDRRPDVLRAGGCPLVMVGRRSDNAGLSYVDVDIDHAMDMALGHLVALGHRSIAMLAYDPVLQEKRYGFMTWTLRAYETACERHGLRPRPWLARPTSDAMTILATHMLATDPEVTACITPEQVSTTGLLRAAREVGRRVPNDLSVLAMLGEDVPAELATPPLTAIGFPARELGALAGEMLLERLGHGRPTEHKLVRPRLTVRGSTRRPSGAFLRKAALAAS